MNLIGIHYGSFVTSWMDDQLPLIRRVKSLGFDLLEFGAEFLLGMPPAARRVFREEAEREGIALALSLGLSPEEDIGSPDSRYRNAGMQKLKATARAMAEVGATDCSGIVHGAWNGRISDYSEKAVYRSNSVASMKEVAGVLEETGVYLNVEVVNRFENFLINTCDEALEYLDDVGSSHLGIHLDTFHMNIEEDSMVKAIAGAGDRLRYFHIGENNRKLPGLGGMPWRTIFDMLAAIGYSGPITMEPFVVPGGEVGSAVSLYRPLMDTSNLDADIRQSLRFVRSMLG